jgi:hypothetical protein
MRWLVRGGLAVALIGALALGRWIDQAWPTDRMAVASYERTGGVGDRVATRWADLRVEGVTASTRLANTQAVVSTSGVWLVLDVTLWAQKQDLSVVEWRVVDAEGRTFVTDARTGYSLGTATPKVPWHVRVAFELPTGDLVGTTLRVSPRALDERREDVAVIDLGVDDDHAAELETLTDLVPIRASSSLEQPPLPGEPGYDDVFKDES